MRRLRIFRRRSGMLMLVFMTGVWYLSQSLGLHNAITNPVVIFVNASQRAYDQLSRATTQKKPRVYLDENIPPQCLCKDNETGIEYDFCYHLPENRSIFGKKFPCHHLAAAKAIGVLETQNFIHLNPQEPFPTPVFVTGASDSHFNEEKKMIFTVQKHFPNQRIVFYDLGLNENHVKVIKSLCQVEYRKFKWDIFPSEVKLLMHYRWKPLIIADSLREFRVVWWMDSSVVWKKSDLSHVYRLVQCNGRSPEDRQGMTNMTDKNGEVPVHDSFWVESGWHVPEWAASVRRCDKFPYLLQGFTGHGIFPATHPGVYKYIPTIESKLKTTAAKMYEAGFLFAVQTPSVIRDVVKWYALCALEKDCMAPSGANLGCRFKGADRYHSFAQCHRFDQSVVNLLLANRNHYDRYYYTSGIVDFFNIQRGGSGANPNVCNGDNPAPN